MNEIYSLNSSVNIYTLLMALRYRLSKIKALAAVANSNEFTNLNEAYISDYLTTLEDLANELIELSDLLTAKLKPNNSD